MSTYTGSFTAVENACGPLMIKPKETVSFTLAGTWVATVLLEKSTVGADTGFSSVTSATANGTTTYKNDENIPAWFRLRVSAYTSGTVTATLADSAGDVVNEYSTKYGDRGWFIDDSGAFCVTSLKVNGLTLPAGTGTLNSVPYYSTTTTLTGSANLLHDGTNTAFGGVAIATTATVRIRKAYTDTSGVQLNVSSSTCSVTANASITMGHIDAGANHGTIATGITNSGTQYGIRAYAARSSGATDDGTLSDMRASWFYFGHASGIGSNATTTAAYGVYIQPDYRAGTVTSGYGLYIAAPNGTEGTVTNRYAIYQAASADTNYFAGQILYTTYKMHPHEYDAGNSSTAITLNWTNGASQKVTLTGNATFTLSNPVTGGFYNIKLLQDATGSRTVTWPAAVKWAAGTAPTLTTTASRTDFVSLYYDGSFYIGSFALNYNLA